MVLLSNNCLQRYKELGKEQNKSDFLFSFYRKEIATDCLVNSFFICTFAPTNNFFNSV
jgi:hypothetical protein